VRLGVFLIYVLYKPRMMRMVFPWIVDLICARFITISFFQYFVVAWKQNIRHILGIYLNNDDRLVSGILAVLCHLPSRGSRFAPLHLGSLVAFAATSIFIAAFAYQFRFVSWMLSAHARLKLSMI